MSKIYESNRLYRLVKRYFIFCFKRFYGEYIIHGKENIPEGPVIFAANHLNALMDALAVISLMQKNKPVVYMGRADYFRNKIVSKIMHFCKLLPAYRKRDGLKNVEKNNAVFDQCIEVLNNNVPLGIMPEGNQGPYRKLRPLVKGIFRIAFSAQEKYGVNPGVKIVPVGLDQGNWDKFGEHIIINVGKPIEVSDYWTLYQENPVEAINQLRNRLSNDLISLTLNLATEENYDCFETAVEVANTAVVQKNKLPNKTLFRFFARQNIGRALVKLEQRHPEKTEHLSRICAEYKENIRRLNLHSWVLEKKNYNLRGLFVNGILLLITLPVFFVGFLLNLLPAFSPDLIMKVFKIHFPGGRGSLRYGLGIITFPVFYLIQGFMIYKKFGGNLWNLLFIVPLEYISGKLAFYWYENFIKFRVKLRYMKLKRQNSSELIKTIQLHEEIIQIVQAS